MRVGPLLGALVGAACGTGAFVVPLGDGGTARAAAAAEPASASAPTPAQAPATVPPPRPVAAFEMGPIERVTLADAVKRALGHNPTVAVAVAEIDRAGALVKQARAGWYPTLSANGIYTRLDSDRKIGSTGQIVANGNQLTANLLLTVPLVAAPAWTNTKHAESTRRIAEASAVDVRRQVAQGTARAYLTVVAQHRLVAAVETARTSSKEHYDYAHARFAGGIGRAIDEVRAAQDLASVDRQVQSSYVALAQAREALGIFLATAGPVDSVDEVDLGPVPALTQALQDARNLRSDVKLDAVRLTAAEQLADDVWAYYAPYLSAVGQPFIQEPPTSLQPKFGWQAQLLLTLPLYDGGTRTGVSRERQALLAEARTNGDALLRQAASDVRISFEAMLRADQALVSARDASRLARRAYELATLAYRGGASTNIEVLDAARQERDADTAAAQAEDLSRQARLDLLVSSGHFP